MIGGKSRQFLHTNYSTLSFNCIATTTSILKKKNTHFKASILNYNILKGLDNISHQNEIIFVLLLVAIKIMIFGLYNMKGSGNLQSSGTTFYI